MLENIKTKYPLKKLLYAYFFLQIKLSYVA